MKKYEMLYILDVELTDEVKDAIIAKFESVVTNDGGTVEKTEKWGVKKLAYPIDYKTDGYYVYMTFEGGPNLVKELKRIARITEGVVRRFIVNV